MITFTSHSATLIATLDIQNYVASKPIVLLIHDKLKAVTSSRLTLKLNQ